MPGDGFQGLEAPRPRASHAGQPSQHREPIQPSAIDQLELGNATNWMRPTTLTLITSGKNTHLPAVQQLPVKATVGCLIGTQARFSRQSILLPGLHGQLPRHCRLAWRAPFMSPSAVHAASRCVIGVNVSCALTQSDACTGSFSQAT